MPIGCVSSERRREENDLGEYRRRGADRVHHLVVLARPLVGRTEFNVHHEAPKGHKPTKCTKGLLSLFGNSVISAEKKRAGRAGQPVEFQFPPKLKKRTKMIISDPDLSAPYLEAQEQGCGPKVTAFAGSASPRDQFNFVSFVGFVVNQ